MMIDTHPSTAAQAKAFTAPGSLAFPQFGRAVGDITNGSTAASSAATPSIPGETPAEKPATPATPAATPVATPNGGSGLTPTLQ
jgi:transcription initiation factor TFIID TATA-box-binding protein